MVRNFDIRDHLYPLLRKTYFFVVMKNQMHRGYYHSHFYSNIHMRLKSMLNFGVQRV